MAKATMPKASISRKGMKTRNGKPPECCFCECGDHAWSPLTQGRITLVSPEDSYLLKSWHWTSNRGYAQRMDTKLGVQLLHRLVCGTGPEMWTDHKNGDPSDNRRSNLRQCSPQQNSFNVGKKRKHVVNKGVRRRGSRWQARIGYNWSTISLGFFKTEAEAVAAYNSAAERLFGDFAKVNVC